MNPHIYIGLPDRVKVAYRNKAQHYIISLACSTFGITEEELISKSRVSRLVKIRAITAYFLRNRTILSLKQIGELIGGRDHSSVIYLIDQVKNREYDSMMIEMFQEFEKNFNRQ